MYVLSNNVCFNHCTSSDTDTRNAYLVEKQKQHESELLALMMRNFRSSDQHGISPHVLDHSHSRDFLISQSHSNDDLIVRT